MNEQQAKTTAEAARPQYQVPAGAQVTWIQKRFIELGIGEADLPRPVRDLLAWIVHFQEGIAWIELAVEDATAQVVRVTRSRAMFPGEIDALRKQQEQQQLEQQGQASSGGESMIY
ncbi:MAG TPA: hypothetical protein VGP99_08345 [Tepidisphaeraceae bacterium]|jgi:hypothetical protein|nr:hypothetical protein [Tepidisphaeraceae bacterium]